MPKINRIDVLYKKSLRIIEQDIKHLGSLVIGEKLKPDYAMDLTRYVKLLAEMKKAQEKAKDDAAVAAKKATKAVSDEELEAALTAKVE